MIKQITDSKTFLEICDKLKDVKDCKLKQDKFYTYCSVITIGDDITGELTLFVVFQWINPHYRKLWKDYMKFIEGKAKEYKVAKISFTTARSEKAIDRQMGKFGYKKIYNVIEKEVV